MKTILKITLVLFAVIFITNCESKTDSSAAELIPVDTLFVQDFEEIVSAESALLAQPVDLEYMDEDHFAVLDHGMIKVITFSYSGKKISEFGNSGNGPGEWGSRTSDLNFLNDKFLIFNRGQLKADIFTKEGDYLKSVSLPPYLKDTSKRLLADDKLLVVTNGNEHALAAILDLNSGGKVFQKIGTPKVEYSAISDADKVRLTLSNGQIPNEIINFALARPFDSGFVTFMLSLGEIRKYDENGELLTSTEIPESIKNSIFDFTVKQNKNESGMAFPLHYALSVESAENALYVLVPGYNMFDDAILPHLLIYNQDLELIKQLAIKDGQKQSLIYDFIISPGGGLLFLDFMGARILKTQIP